MKFKILFFLVLICNSLFAQTSGTGCNIGSSIYTEYLGMAPYYGNVNNMVRVYKNSGNSIDINSNSSNRYQCGKINVYPQGSYYDNSIPPYGANVTIPAQNEIISQGADNSCVTSPSLAAAGNGNVNNNGKYATFTYNNPTYCNVSLDDYIPFLILFMTGLGFYHINKRKPNISPVN
ncbi:hypothetical protein EZ428_10975 [Pedobacter frigiditerrae]|uniref:Secreted protein n=1 Tax=Pedobacter frigiditerrae TaxID=2530452 RepID=A0A4R0MY55_9SPHI|nr:hypothetical protein [Pedobacter frigiditerrae]TCC92241.1 hypothetical protein EZ428_10975 [Pedobacter frigiditerrae]